MNVSAQFGSNIQHESPERLPKKQQVSNYVTLAMPHEHTMATSQILKKKHSAMQLKAVHCRCLQLWAHIFFQPMANKYAGVRHVTLPLALE